MVVYVVGFRRLEQRGWQEAVGLNLLGSISPPNHSNNNNKKKN